MSIVQPGRARTKIVATVGPACREESQLTELVEAGVDVFRLNMAHADLEQHSTVFRTVRGISRKLGRPIGLLADLAGPKIRVGEISGGEMELRLGAEIRIVRGEAAREPNELVTTYVPLVDELSVGDRVMLADGTIGLAVEEKKADMVRCRVVQPGTLRSRQGLNLPGVKLSTPSMSPTDWEHAEWAARMGIDFVGLSFVRTPVEVRLLKELLRTHGSKAQVIAKIEKQEALDQLEAIVETADAVMVARGDLGVEIDVARMPVVQKQIVATCHLHQKPVIVATQMLDSMQHSRQPTRAEATDVGNAILDGCDACMLSGETAIGEYPRAAVEMMNRIALATEPLFKDRPPPQAPQISAQGLKPITRAVVYGASRIASELDARLIAVATKSGASALALSKLRCLVPTVGVSDVEETLRQMCLYWGVTPLAGSPSADAATMLENVTTWGHQCGYLTSGNRIILVTVTPAGSGHNMVVVHEVK
jgi:pyruvate kinase